jgi:hypothetical protein
VKALSLRPYNGKLFVATSRQDYERSHIKLFGGADPLLTGYCGRYAAGSGPDGVWTYLIWADAAHTLAHELSHVILHVFERCGIDPRQADGEPFCYMLSQLMLDASRIK